MDYIIKSVVFLIKKKILNFFYFLKVPFDELRLVFPPVPALLIASILYQPILGLHYLSIINFPRLILAGSLAGYLMYDMIHYYLHYGNPQKFEYFYKLKRYHHHHHFVHHSKGFGISSTFWDTIFGTEIFLKKLKYVLKW
jgi:4-hydroxysphinganine ceramide fatty acyl 2-hydroxylase